jgi:hypothetical protein
MGLKHPTNLHNRSNFAAHYRNCFKKKLSVNFSSIPDLVFHLSESLFDLTALL